MIQKRRKTSKSIVNDTKNGKKVQADESLLNANPL